LDQAMQRVDAALAQKPRDAQMRFFKGLILTEQGKTADAIGVFQRLTEDYPELPEPYNNLAVLYASQGEYEKARASLEMAIRTHPSYATAHENLGDVYAKLASQAYDKALQLDSTNTAAQSKLALIKELISVNGAPSKKPGAAPSPGAMSASPASASASHPAPAPTAAVSTAAPAPSSSASPPVKPSPPPLVASANPPAAAPPVKAPATPAPNSAPVAAAASPAPVVTAPPKPAAPPVASATAAPSTPPVPTAVEHSTTPLDSPEKSEVAAAVNAWAHAWASKDVSSYLAAYAEDFATPGGESRQQWEEDRKARIIGKSSITIKLDDVDVNVQGDHAVVRFRQDYHADRLAANSRKTLTLVRTNGKWLIQQERTGA
jgi:ketosteroid isomerase-like protein